MLKHQPLIFEISKTGRNAYSLPECDVPVCGGIDSKYLRSKAPELPEVSELDAVRHFTQLSQRNHGVDSGFYPLGSCTMKYNPKMNEAVARFDGFAKVHPYQTEETVQGALELIYNLNNMLSEITGMDDISLQPAAGAHGELAGLMIMKEYHRNKGDFKRNIIVVPDSAHGTNPASAAVAGFDVVEIKSDDRGLVDIESLKAVMSDEVAGFMLTNPNTLGLFDENILEISQIVHEAGGLMYYDGANANAILGITRPGDMGFDVVHLNLHKTFSTPHGGGGPGSGPVGVKKHLADFLPVPVVVKSEDKYAFDYNRPLSIGKVKSFYGHFGVYARAYAYILSMGPDGLREVAQNAVLNANYIASRLKDKYYLPVDRICMHECVLSGIWQKEKGVSTLDIAKRLLDFGYHPPTIYFPLIVSEALMIEPTECESKETLDKFIEAMRQIADEAENNPELVTSAPHTTVVSRLDEATAARKPITRYKK
ncbi:aminomethyl-transferring glycine dehydrogenase subunit GcvPB [Sedimentibacter hydroxybenzoicus DSM 7310]|uniref:Probable glycine dehydrogenase (decarboxylating) subunit 2 n=1 Tax=Sedimentibacter hydroxybenzoicus DSM 7310 TaxID=1123245 RepID=A0A974BMU1_SEDHY|nr:aminomethyl-transferring glycine dehydrogenase subunit GcvPB [Sedimentibacter hydroxybenzoicus]NYB75776.1 aminomethyl-transferring glycine dehydrogenase subunit GcvPB [Sedimentibacter hydroxybenzoicus DSM 7310]